MEFSKMEKVIVQGIAVELKDKDDSYKEGFFNGLRLAKEFLEIIATSEKEVKKG